MKNTQAWMFLSVLILSISVPAMSNASEPLDQKISRLKQSFEAVIYRSDSARKAGQDKTALNFLSTATQILNEIPLQTTSGRLSGIPGGAMRRYHVELAKRYAGLDDKQAEDQFKTALSVPQIFGDTEGLPEAQRAYAEFKSKSGDHSASRKLESRATCVEKLAAAERSLSSNDVGLMDKKTKEAVETTKNAGGQDDLLFVALRWRARALEQQKKFKDARLPLEERLSMAKGLKSDELVGESMLDLAMNSECQGDFAEAEKQYESSIASYTKSGRPDNYAKNRLEHLRDNRKKGLLNEKKPKNQSPP